MVADALHVHANVSLAFSAPCDVNLELSSVGAHNWPPVFHPRHFVVYFRLGKLQRSQAVIQPCGKKEMKEQRGGERREREASHRFLSLSPMNAPWVTKVDVR